MTHTSLRGIATISFWAADLEAAKTWYTDLLGMQPYFERSMPNDPKPAYYEFRIGEYQQELGLIDMKYAPKGFKGGPGGAVVYWHVEDVQVTFERLLAMGAKQLEPPQDRGEGFITASVIDPFGNLLGVMYNPHFVEVLESSSGAGQRSA
jgi:predicted enzyme related to lactoylglutathione lyase